MTIKEFNYALKLAAGNEDLGTPIPAFFGFGLKEFQPIHVTCLQLAALIRYEARYLNGGFDQEALTEIKKHGRKKFIIY